MRVRDEVGVICVLGACESSQRGDNRRGFVKRGGGWPWPSRGSVDRVAPMISISYGGVLTPVGRLLVLLSWWRGWARRFAMGCPVAGLAVFPVWAA